MTGKLVMRPLRVWFRSARLLTRAAVGAVERAYSLARPAQSPEHRDVPFHGAPLRDEPLRYEPRDAEPRDEEPRHEATAPPQPGPEHVRPLHPSLPEEPGDVPPVPVHVSEEPELVRESAEPGAVDGAGAGVTVMEPWNGYADMNAREVIARARHAGRAELAAVRLYEARHRSRQTVLAAVDRQLKVGNGSDPA